MSEVTTIKVRKETREALKELGRKGETYDHIINKTIDAYIAQKQKRVGNMGMATEDIALQQSKKIKLDPQDKVEVQM